MEKELKTCCYPDCLKADKDVAEGFCLEHANLARFIIDLVGTNISLGDLS